MLEANTPRHARTAAQATMVIALMSVSFVPAKPIDPCGAVWLGVTEGQEYFTRKSQPLVAKTLIDLTNDAVLMRLFNPAD